MEICLFTCVKQHQSTHDFNKSKTVTTEEEVLSYNNILPVVNVLSTFDPELWKLKKKKNSLEPEFCQIVRLNAQFFSLYGGSIYYTIPIMRVRWKLMNVNLLSADCTVNNVFLWLLRAWMTSIAPSTDFSVWFTYLSQLIFYTFMNVLVDGT